MHDNRDEDKDEYIKGFHLSFPEPVSNMDSKQENRKLKASMSILTLSQVHSWAMRAKIVVCFRRNEEGPKDPIVFPITDKTSSLEGPTSLSQ